MSIATASGPADKRAGVLTSWLEGGAWGWVLEADCPVCDDSPAILVFGEYVEPEYQDGQLLASGGARATAHAATCGCQLTPSEERELYDRVQAQADADVEGTWRETKALKREARHAY